MCSAIKKLFKRAYNAILKRYSVPQELIDEMKERVIDDVAQYMIADMEENDCIDDPEAFQESVKYYKGLTQNEIHELLQNACPYISTEREQRVVFALFEDDDTILDKALDIATDVIIEESDVLKRSHKQLLSSVNGMYIRSL